MRTFVYTPTLGLLCICIFVVMQARAAIYTVTSTNNSGTGTLRQAILDANANSGQDTIRFNIIDGGGGSQYFEGTAPARYAVIRLSSPLPIITGGVLIDGFTQANTNTGVMAGRTVGVDNIAQPNINFPDVYIVPRIGTGLYVRATNTDDAAGGYGNGININATNVTIRGIAISGFGNTNAGADRAGLSGDICIIRATAIRNANTIISDCFIGTDPTGTPPSVASNRRSLGAAIIIGGNNWGGTIARNFMRELGTYGIHFNGVVDHALTGPTAFDPIRGVFRTVNLSNRNWLIENNQLIDISWNNSFVGPGNFVTSSTGLVADAINIMNCKRFMIRNNYIENVEQVGIDIGWNADSNFVANNSITRFTKAYSGPVQCGIRAALASRGDTLFRNRIFNNQGTAFMGGIWIDRSTPFNPVTDAPPGITSYDNNRHVAIENMIYDNRSSGIVMSTFSPLTSFVNATQNTFSRNITYNNTGLGIDLGLTGSNGVTPPVFGSISVTPNDNGDIDVGLNELQNFPIIDSVKVNPPGTFLNVFGKAPAGAVLEFYYSDGQINQHGGFTLNYGEGRTYIGTGVEGSVADLATGTGSYNIDGNIAVNNNNLFRFVLPITGAPPAGTRLTATATVNRSTSEFAPYDVAGFIVLSHCEVLEWKGTAQTNGNLLEWKAECGKEFSHFELEYSIDNRQFTQLAVIDASQGLAERQYLHAQPPASAVYYRLKNVNLDGSFTYSRTILVRNTKSIQSMQVMPVPFRSRFTIQVTAAVKTEAMVTLLDFTGRRVVSQRVRLERGLNQVPVEQLDQLPAGAYVVELVDVFTGLSQSHRISKQ